MPKLAPPPTRAQLIEARLDAPDAVLVLNSGTTLFHVHESSHPATSFNPGTGEGRFHVFHDDAGAPVPVFYAALSVHGAFCETVFRSLPSGTTSRRVPRKRILRYSCSELALVEPLTSTRLSGNALHRLHVTRNLLLDSGPRFYQATSAWAKAIHDAYPGLTGISWTSRQHDASICVMLFGDRVGPSDLFTLKQIRLDTDAGQDLADKIAHDLDIVITR